MTSTYAARRFRLRAADAVQVRTSCDADFVAWVAKGVPLHSRVESTTNHQRRHVTDRRSGR